VLLMRGSGAIDYRVSLVTLVTPLVVQRLVGLAFDVTFLALTVSFPLSTNRLMLGALSIILVADQVGLGTIRDEFAACTNEVNSSRRRSILRLVFERGVGALPTIWSVATALLIRWVLAVKAIELDDTGIVMAVDFCETLVLKFAVARQRICMAKLARALVGLPTSGRLPLPVFGARVLGGAGRADRVVARLACQLACAFRGVNAG
jgi:hypothetical protein